VCAHVGDRSLRVRCRGGPGDVCAPSGARWRPPPTRLTSDTDRLIASHPGQDLIIVAHFGAILTQVQRALDITAYQAFAHKIDNLSVTELHKKPTGWHVETVNHCP